MCSGVGARRARAQRATRAYTTPNRMHAFLPLAHLGLLDSSSSPPLDDLLQISASSLRRRQINTSRRALKHQVRVAKQQFRLRTNIEPASVVMQESLVPVWVWHDYNNSLPSRYIQLNLLALRRHAPPSHFVIHYVNRSNIAQHVPDLPDAFWRLPTHVAFSDAARLALLAIRGGLYVDTDFLILRSLVPVAELLQKVDVVGYPTSPPHGVAPTSSQCATSGLLSANFLAARPNTTMFRRAWDHFRRLLPRRCQASRARKVNICCRDPHTDAPLDYCRVPHATTDLMLQRARLFPDVLHANASDAGRVIDGIGGLHRQSNTTIYCFGGTDDLTTPRLRPMQDGRDRHDVALQLVLGIPLLGTRLCYGKWRLLSRSLGCEICPRPARERYLVCCARDGDDLVCQNRWRANHSGAIQARSAGFYARGRLAYHLFDSFQRHEFLLRDQIEWSNLTVAPLYRRALGLTNE